jgi:hypothetical protein
MSSSSCGKNWGGARPVPVLAVAHPPFVVPADEGFARETIYSVRLDGVAVALESGKLLRSAWDLCRCSRYRHHPPVAPRLQRAQEVQYILLLRRTELLEVVDHTIGLGARACMGKYRLQQI